MTSPTRGSSSKPPASRKLRLLFARPIDRRAGAFLTMGSATAMAALVVRGCRRDVAPRTRTAGGAAGCRQPRGVDRHR